MPGKVAAIGHPGRLPKLVSGTAVVAALFVLPGCQTIFSHHSGSSSKPQPPKPASSAAASQTTPPITSGGILHSIENFFAPHTGSDSNPASAKSPILPPSEVLGAYNDNVTQSTIVSTICHARWASTVAEPPSPYLNQIEQLALGAGGTVTYLGASYTIQGLNENDRNPAHYLVDPLVSVNLGGDPANPANLWVEPYESPAGPAPVGTGAQTKTKVETYLNKQVCDGKMTLEQAQLGIIHDWGQYVPSADPPPPTPTKKR